MNPSGFIVLIATIIASRIINERGYRHLSAEEKVRLMDGFSKARAYAMIPAFIVIGGYFILIKNTDLDRGILTMAYFGLLILYVIVRTILNHKKMSELDMPERYRKMFSLSQIISLIGVAWFFYSFLGPMLG
jgi:hypothetical protein